jgi:hypothetical protein
MSTSPTGQRHALQPSAGGRTPKHGTYVRCRCRRSRRRTIAGHAALTTPYRHTTRPSDREAKAARTGGRTQERGTEGRRDRRKGSGRRQNLASAPSLRLTANVGGIPPDQGSTRSQIRNVASRISAGNATRPDMPSLQTLETPHPQRAMRHARSAAVPPRRRHEAGPTGPALPPPARTASSPLHPAPAIGFLTARLPDGEGSGVRKTRSVCVYEGGGGRSTKNRPKSQQPPGPLSPNRSFE